MNGNEIRDLLGEGIGTEPPIVGGPAAVFAGARRRTARTRAITGALSAVAVLGIAAGAVVIAGGEGKSGREVPPGVTAPDAAHRTGTARLMPGVMYPSLDFKKVPAGQVLVTGRSVSELLKVLLPAGIKTANYSGMDNVSQESTEIVFGQMSAQDGSGKLTRVSATVERVVSGASLTAPCTDQFHKVPDISGCRAVPQQDGTVVAVYRVNEYHANTNGPAPGAYEYTAERVYPNGLEIVLGATNWYYPPTMQNGKPWTVAPSAPDPLLTEDELAAMVMDPRWGYTVPADFARQAEEDITPYQELGSP